MLIGAQCHLVLHSVTSAERGRKACEALHLPSAAEILHDQEYGKPLQLTEASWVGCKACQAQALALLSSLHSLQEPL